MQQIAKIIVTLSTIILLVSCGSQSPDATAQKVAAKKAEVEQLKAEQRTLAEKILNLEKEIIDIDPTQKKENPRLVAIAPVTAGAFTHYIDLQGRVDATNIAYVAPRGPGGLVKAVYVKQGDNVKKGQLLLKLDDALTQKQLDQLNTQLDYAKDLLKRQQNLWDQNIGTEVQLLNAKNTVANIEKQIAAVNEQASFSNVYAEISGVAETVNIKVGEFFQGGPQIRIVNTNDLKAVAQVPENYLEKVKVGNNVVLNFPDINKTVETKVSVAGKLIDPNTRSFYIEARLPQSKDFLPNQIVLVKIQDYSAGSVLTIPVNTLQNDDKGKYVMVAVAENDKILAQKKYISIGQTYADKVEVTSGITAGDQVIVDGFQGLYEGQLLTTN
ncbi:MAG: efflux RND transporter periplasmic adaptor subunit [Chitinophagaceae bacterium]|nr:efflux RND transporter periplasmic adaptor subunit [Chitinophagaceae bacterium]MCW5928564.1 efflux RND transporter periplasmic adaptor subunit [Chitinophagaceae bacterium]